MHIYYNATRKAENDYKFEQELISIKELLEDGMLPSQLNEGAQKKADKYLKIRARGKTRHISYNEEACNEKKKHHGYFTLVSNSEKDTFSALAKYRKREYVENHFRLSKQSADGTRIRVWDADVLRGRMFVQFVALCYYEFLAEEVRKLKLDLGSEFDGLNRKTNPQKSVLCLLISCQKSIVYRRHLSFYNLKEISAKLLSYPKLYFQFIFYIAC